jgi:Glycosyltransferase
MNHSLTRSCKILQVLPALNSGGVERGTVEVAIALKNKGHIPYVASSGGALVSTLQENGIQHIDLPLGAKNPLVILQNIKRLKNLIQQEQIDLIHARSRAPAWSAYGAAKLCKIPFVTTFHGTYNFKTSLKRYYNSVMVKGDRVIAISPFIFRHILQHYQGYIDESRITVIDRVVDLMQFNPHLITAHRKTTLLEAWDVPETAKILLMPARLTRWKGQLVVLEALQDVVADYPECVCVFVGSDQGRTDYTQECKQKVTVLGLEKHVRFVDHVKDMPAAYALSALVIHASTDPEAFGRVIVEAQAMDVPVIASRLGAPQDTILEGVTGWLHTPGNGHDLAAKIKEVLALPAKERQRIGEMAKRRVQEKYDATILFAKTIKLYEDLIHEI